MDNLVFFPLLGVMILVTYLIRALPFTLFRRKIENPHLKAFFDYIPYTVLSAMTFPAILYSTGDSTAAITGAAAGLVIALILSWRGKSLLTVAIATSAVVLVVSLVVMWCGV